jgi:hypothetical protein
MTKNEVYSDAQTGDRQSVFDSDYQSFELRRTLDTSFVQPHIPAVPLFFRYLPIESPRPFSKPACPPTLAL